MQMGPPHNVLETLYIATTRSTFDFQLSQTALFRPFLNKNLNLSHKSLIALRDYGRIKH